MRCFIHTGGPRITIQHLISVTALNCKLSQDTHQSSVSFLNTQESHSRNTKWIMAIMKSPHYPLCTKTCVREKAHFLNLMFYNNEWTVFTKFSQFIAFPFLTISSYYTFCYKIFCHFTLKFGSNNCIQF